MMAIGLKKWFSIMHKKKKKDFTQSKSHIFKSYGNIVSVTKLNFKMVQARFRHISKY